MTTNTIWYKSPLLYFQLLTHASIIPMIMYGNGIHWLIALCFYYLFGCWGVAITFHRLTSHKSFQCPSWFRFIGLTLGSLGGVGSIIEWTAVHRDHHRHTDTDRDPHLPSKSWKHFLYVQFFTMLAPSSPKYVTDLLRDQLMVKMHKYYWLIHLAYAAILCIIDPFAIVYAYLIPGLLLWHTMTSLGTFAHVNKFGYRNYDSKDNSRNLLFLGWFGFGEGYHNNHHAETANYKFGRNKFEFDLSATIINLIKK